MLPDGAQSTRGKSLETNDKNVQSASADISLRPIPDSVDDQFSVVREGDSNASSQRILLNTSNIYVL